MLVIDSLLLLPEMFHSDEENDILKIYCFVSSSSLKVKHIRASTSFNVEKKHHSVAFNDQTGCDSSFIRGREEQSDDIKKNCTILDITGKGR